MSEDGRYVIAVGRGDTTRAIAAEATQAAVEFGLKAGIQRFLIDLTESRNVEPPLESVQFAREDAPQVSSEHCFAILVDPSDHSHDFQVAIGRAQGFNVALFTDREKAIEHLMEATDEGP